ncbi:pyridoxal phosphate-dependent aminotransferase [Selenomonas artemidis]|jgi:aspartate aminotransferase|uniref:Aminotransferase n=1 Tax=Selenomonas artemidis F0399 TaxID=749551 RepID=E7N2U0_9FIRM|nr:pyridoxal phosphate-dependent aminotransferase [Selenomonas artemidis]EFW29501.1 aminotransferase, class I/II [Selenomonas artemidis F0399]
MVSEEMYRLGTKKSTIRSIFEYGRQRAAEVGAENVFDFSLGNPNVPAPDFIRDAAVDILMHNDPIEVHGYTIAPGKPEVRETIAADLSKRLDMRVAGKNLFMTAGAAASVTIVFKALCEAGDEFVTFAPFFPEYRVFVESVGGRLTVVPAKTDDFQINFDAFEHAVTSKTKAVIVNSPNNPSGAVYNAETITRLADFLRRKEEEYGHTIFIIADEPYREIVYVEAAVPCIPNFYDDTIVCYSYSKSFSLPGERIGYILVPDAAADFDRVYGAIAGAARVLTHVNAPSLWQLVAARCAGRDADLSMYRMNASLLFEGLTEAGFSCMRPQGAFYLFPQALEPDDEAFCERAKSYDLLLVPGADFGCPGYFRAAYCVSTDMIRRSLPQFQKLVESYR